VTERAGDSHPGFDWYPAETMGTHHAVSDLDQEQMAFRLARITNFFSGRQEPKIDHADRLQDHRIVEVPKTRIASPRERDGSAMRLPSGWTAPAVASVLHNRLNNAGLLSP